MLVDDSGEKEFLVFRESDIIGKLDRSIAIDRFAPRVDKSAASQSVDDEIRRNKKFWLIFFVIYCILSYIVFQI